ncbi:MAG: homoserine O-succinyltransferase [Myxococcota bacterium]|jgi:homoserine O-succinyltransferase
MPTVALIDLNARHDNHGVSSITTMIKAAGYRVERFEPRVEGTLPGPGFDAYILTGGPGSPLEDAPWRHELLAAVGQWKAPVVGVCMGFQLLAQVHGWTVRQLSHPRFGIHRLRLTGAGRAHPLTAPLAADAAFEQRRFGVFAPDSDERPTGDILATGEDGDITAARFAPNVLGVIFHPEAAPGLVAQLFTENDTIREKLLERHGPERFRRMVDLIPRLEGPFRTILPGFLHQARRLNQGPPCSA